MRAGARAATARRRFTGAALVVVSPGVPWDAARAARRRARAGVPVIAELELGFRLPARARWPRSPAPRASPRPPPPSARCCARRAATCAWAATSAQAVTGLVEGATDGRPSSCSRSRASSSRAPTRFHPQRGRLPEPLRRPPRPPRQLRGVRAGQGAHLREPDRGRLGGGERRRPGGAGAGAARAARGRCRSIPPAPAASDGAFFDGRRRALRSDGAHGDASSPRATCALPGDAPGAATSWPRPPPRACWARRAEAIAPRRARLPRRRARAGARGRDRRRRLLQRLQGHQRRGRAQEPGGLRRPGARDPRRPLQGRRLRATWRPPLRAHGKAVLAIGEATRAHRARRSRRWCRWCRCDSPARGGGARLRRWPRPATPCCWPPPARPSTCSRTTPPAAAPSRTRSRRAGRARGHARG